MQKKSKTISSTKDKHPIEFDYHFGGHQIERVYEHKDFRVVLDSRMTFLSHIELIISKSARMLGCIKRISKEFNDYYTLKTRFVPIWNMPPVSGLLIINHSERIERI
jgi:hypothetical protein